MTSNQHYFDYAAATPLDPRVLQAIQPYFERLFYNPSATYAAGHHVHADINNARAKVAHWLGARPSEIIFTAGGSEANNLAIHGIMRCFPNANIAISGIEHDSVLAPATHYDHHQIAVQTDGRITAEALRQAIDDQTVLVSIMYANNEIGTIEPLHHLAKTIEAARRDRTKRLGNDGLPLYFHSDACQAANYLDLHVARLGVDLMSLNGGKIYGPKQSGGLYVKAGLQLMPLIDGGGQERGLRSGTENVAAAIGFAKALELVQTERSIEARRLQSLQQQLIKMIGQELPEATINGSLQYRLPNNLHLTFPGIDNERLLIQLDGAGIQAAAGSACSASNETPSHVLRAIGLTDDAARSSLRLTMGQATDDKDTSYLVDRLKAFV